MHNRWVGWGADGGFSLKYDNRALSIDCFIFHDHDHFFLSVLLRFRGKDLMVVFKVDQISLVIRVMHFGMYISGVQYSLTWCNWVIEFLTYLYRVGATLRTIGAYKLMDKEPLRRFLLACQSEVPFVFPIILFACL